MATGKTTNGQTTVRWLGLLVAVALAVGTAAAVLFGLENRVAQNTTAIESLNGMDGRLRRVEFLVVQMAAQQGIDVAFE